jgi:hypothetical protein
MTSTHDPFPEREATRRWWLWVVAFLVIAGSILAVVIVRGRTGSRSLRQQQGELFQILGDAIVELAKQKDGELHGDLTVLTVRDAAGRHIDVATLLTDKATGKPETYRIVTPSGEQLRYQFLGERIIAWSPVASYDGKRALLLNGVDVAFAQDNAIDLVEQRLDTFKSMGSMRPTILTAGGAGASEEEDSEPTTEPSPAPDATTGPDD